MFVVRGAKRVDLCRPCSVCVHLFRVCLHANVKYGTVLLCLIFWFALFSVQAAVILS
jgi:hypothetical protein